MSVRVGSTEEKYKGNKGLKWLLSGALTARQILR